VDDHFANGQIIYTLERCGIFGLKPDGQVAWKVEELDKAPLPDCNGPVSDGQLAWFCHNNWLVCADAKAGKVVYEQDVGEGASFASLILVNDKLYLFGQHKTLIVQAGRTFKPLGTCKLNERFDALPAFDPGRVPSASWSWRCRDSALLPSPRVTVRAGVRSARAERSAARR
jgi:hypothetical protein